MRVTLAGEVSGPLAIHRAGYSLAAEPRLLRLAARIDGALAGSQRVEDFPALWSRLLARVGDDAEAEASPLLRAVLAVEAARARLSLPPWRWANAAPWVPLPALPAVAVTGHRHITAEDAATVARVVREYPAGSWVFGGAIGVDTVALRAAREAGLSWLTVIVPGRVDQQPAEAQAAIRDCADVVVGMRGDLNTRGAGSAYRARNAAMVAEATEVLAFTDGGPSGTRHCMETAREQARPVRVVGIQGNDWRRR